MKKIPYLFILLLCLCVTTISCDDEPLEGEFFATGDGSEPTDTPQTIDGEITADIDGEGFEASGQAAFGAFTAGVLNITGINGTETLIISVSEVDGPGTYDLGVNGVGAGVINVSNPATTSLSNDMGGSGSITIETLDITNLVASGTFEFDAVDNASGVITSVTNGVFNVSLTQDVPTGDTDNMFEVTIDGELYEPDSIQGIFSSIVGVSAISINTNNNDTGQNVSISLPSDITPGDYTFSSLPTVDAVVAQYTPNINNTDSGTFVASSSGTISIISHDTTNNTISGTFSFTAEPALGSPVAGMFEFSEGSFSVVYN